MVAAPDMRYAGSTHLNKQPDSRPSVPLCIFFEFALRCFKEELYKTLDLQWFISTAYYIFALPLVGYQ